MLAVVAFAFRSFARRLERMTRLAEAVAAGDLSVRTGDDRLDELGRLSNAFDDMTQALSVDIARRERVEAQLAYQATHDSLTGLPNRQNLVAELETILRGSDEPVSALFIDLDGFKEVNDRLGHAAGDELLKRVGDRLRDVLRPGDFVARLGGDEFVILLRGLGLIEADRTASRVVGALELPFIVLDEEASISASIGVSSTDSERSAERLLKEADIAMYQAKSLGKGRAIRVTEEALHDVDEQLSLVSALRSAVSNNELELMLWPIADLRNASLVGMEASVRWTDPVRGTIAPAEFLALAERSGFSSLIDEWVVRESLAALAAWRDAGEPVDDLQLSINLTPQSFINQRTRATLVSHIEQYRLDASNIRIEVPEAVLRSDDLPLRDAFKQYRSLGIAITIDRFGSDYSNLDRLPRFAIDAVKIDLGLTADLHNQVSSHALITSLITLAETSGLRVAAAGVDDEVVRDQLLSLGCDSGQGLWFSDIVDRRAFGELLRSRDLLGFLS
ncbi:MAG: EAL domain-containing protein [Acidimicrobiales bacterium]